MIITIKFRINKNQWVAEMLERFYKFCDKFGYEFISFDADEIETEFPQGECQYK